MVFDVLTLSAEFPFRWREVWFENQPREALHQNLSGKFPFWKNFKENSLM